MPSPARQQCGDTKAVVLAEIPRYFVQKETTANIRKSLASLLFGFPSKSVSNAIVPLIPFDANMIPIPLE